MNSGIAFGLPPQHTPSTCLCGSRKPSADCCAAFHQGLRSPNTPEELMRSRYVAFVNHNSDYLLDTWHPTTRPPAISFDPHHEWTGLLVISAPPSTGPTGTVEYRAFAQRAGIPSTLHEISRFQRNNNRWYYVDGDFPSSTPGAAPNST